MKGIVAKRGPPNSGMHNSPKPLSKNKNLYLFILIISIFTYCTRQYFSSTRDLLNDDTSLHITPHASV